MKGMGLALLDAGSCMILLYFKSANRSKYSLETFYLTPMLEGIIMRTFIQAMQ